ncbi:unconventional myosin [Artemisia annua]|uniref:Unconventional myosin n=1 Tax=Artemisia annua TaxID=35608 RepID=A0A2U1K9Q5_ARTAN|nr:unconventional myosin [Artemisia annua]
MPSLQEKVSEMAYENQILRKQAFSSPTKHVPENTNTPETNPSVENGLRGSEEPQASASNSVTDSDSKPKKPPIDRQNENVDALIECVMKDTGFSQGKLLKHLPYTNAFFIGNLLKARELMCLIDLFK